MFKQISPYLSSSEKFFSFYLSLNLKPSETSFLYSVNGERLLRDTKEGPSNEGLL